MTPLPQQVAISIATTTDVARAALAARKLARDIGFDTTTEHAIGTAASELATNIERYAQRGNVILRVISRGGREGIQIIAADDGPGIPDIDQALNENFSTRNSLGMGLPSVRRMMDDFELKSEVGRGTTATATKWK